MTRAGWYLAIGAELAIWGLLAWLYLRDRGR
jgi:hypothetical protein